MTQRPGAVTLLTVFMATAVVFLLLLGDNIHAVAERQRAHQVVQSEQAFYASQSCLEDAYLQLLTNAAYTGASGVPVGNATCDTTVSPATPSSPNGTVTSTGTIATLTRTIGSSYDGAGGTTSRQHTQIFHIIDRSGSMQEDSCSNTIYRNQLSCENHHFVWGPILQPITDTKNAAIQFNTLFDPAYDQLGLVSFNGTATLNHVLTTDVATVNNAIGALTAGGTTDIGAAIDLASAHYSSTTSAAKFAILLTDGVPNSSCDVDCTITKATTMKSSGVTIFTIGLGTATDPDLLKAVASVNPETHQPFYYEAASVDVLGTIYADIAHHIQHFDITQGSWHEQ